MPHTLPSPDDAPARPTRPDGTPWTLSDFVEDIPLDPALAWNSEGVVIKKGFFNDELIDRYRREWILDNGPIARRLHPEAWGDYTGWYVIEGPRIGGYNETGYLRSATLMEICTDRYVALTWENLLGEAAGVNLVLTGWVSTERNWHSDFYLNEECVGDYYGAMWVCLDDVHPDSGPFEYYPGSHLWPGIVTKRMIGKTVDINNPRWPAHSEAVLTPLYEQYAADHRVKKVTYLPKRGDVLWWHGRTVHRGSRANVQNMYRGALIAHFSGINHRTDMPPAARHPRHGGFYYPLGPLGEGV